MNYTQDVEKEEKNSINKTEIYVSKFPHDMRGWFVEKATHGLLAVEYIKSYLKHPEDKDKETLEYAIESAEIYYRTILDMCADK